MVERKKPRIKDARKCKEEEKKLRKANANKKYKKSNTKIKEMKHKKEEERGGRWNRSAQGIKTSSKRSIKI